jgi:malonate transporter MadM subunit
MFIIVHTFQQCQLLFITLFEFLNPILEILQKNGLVFSFLLVGLIMYVSYLLSKILTNHKIPGAAIAISFGLFIAYLGNGEKGIASIPIFSGMAVLGGTMLRDFSIVSTALGASFAEIKKTGLVGLLCLVIGTVLAYIVGGSIAYIMGYTDAKSIATIGAGACTFIVGPVTGSAVGASSSVIAISIAIGVIKSVIVTIATPFVAEKLGIIDPHNAMIFGGLVGSTSGVSAGLAATNPKLVPYGALTATFHTAMGCLLCPSILYFLTQFFID